MHFVVNKKKIKLRFRNMWSLAVKIPNTVLEDKCSVENNKSRLGVYHMYSKYDIFSYSNCRFCSAC